MNLNITKNDVSQLDSAKTTGNVVGQAPICIARKNKPYRQYVIILLVIRKYSAANTIPLYSDFGAFGPLQCLPTSGVF